MSDAPSEQPSGEQAISEEAREDRYFYAEPVWKRFYQLIVAPALIAALLLAAYVMIRMFTSTEESNPDRLVERMEQGSTHGKWQAAFALTQFLQPSITPGSSRIDPSSPAYQGKINEVRLLLPRLLKIWEASDEPEPQMRRFLAMAFAYTQDVRTVPALLEGISAQDIELVVHSAASLAHMLDPLPEKKSTKVVSDALLQPASLEMLLTASKREEPVIRASLLFVLGLLLEPAGGDEEVQKTIVQRLVIGLDDLAADVRWNAAFGLARIGKDEAERVLLDILAEGSTFQQAGLSLDVRNELFLNAVRSAGKILSPKLMVALQQIAAARLGDYPPIVISEAKRVVALAQSADSTDTP